MIKNKLEVGHRYYLTPDQTVTGVFRFQGGQTYYYYFNEVDNMEPLMESLIFPGYVGFPFDPTCGEVPQKTINVDIDLIWN